MRTRRGLTLIELLAALALTAILAATLAVAFRSAIHFAVTNPDQTVASIERSTQDSRLYNLLSQAYLTPDATDNRAFFVASSAAGGLGGNDTLTFTTTGMLPDPRALQPDENVTFEDMNNLVGPQGGIAEVSLSTTAIGDQAPPTANLFMRVQRPADGDPTQGGKETIFIPEVTGVTFEFWNGVNWVSDWDTRTGDRRIPSLVRVTLSRSNQDDQVITVPLRYSDVTQTNPSTQGGVS